MAVLEVNQVLALNIKRLRKQKGWTQKELAHNSGFSQENIARIETSSQWISADGLSSISKALGCSYSDLVQNPDVNDLEDKLTEYLTAFAKMPPEFRAAIKSINWEADGVEDWINQGIKKFKR